MYWIIFKCVNNNLRKLKISHRLTLKKNCFNGLSKLEELYLGFCDFEEGNEQVFTELVNLRILELKLFKDFHMSNSHTINIYINTNLWWE